MTASARRSWTGWIRSATALTGCRSESKTGRIQVVVPLLPICLILCSAAVLRSAVLPAAIQKQLGLRVPMRDGVHLSTSVFRPATKGRVSTILIRTAYGKGSDLSASYEPFLERGYAVVLQDVRGRYGSEGVFRPLTQEGEDGYDT